MNQEGRRWEARGTTEKATGLRMISQAFESVAKFQYNSDILFLLN